MRDWKASKGTEQFAGLLSQPPPIVTQNTLGTCLVPAPNPKLHIGAHLPQLVLVGPQAQTVSILVCSDTNIYDRV